MAAPEQTSPAPAVPLEALVDAFARRLPGPVRQPGPRATTWRPLGRARLPQDGHGDQTGDQDGARTCDGELRLQALLRRAWWSPHHHLDPSTGHPTSVRCRPVPSAGGCYPVQVHALAGEGCDVLPGRYVLTSQTGQLARIGTTTWPSGALLILSVLPQRTTAKYQHRAWPLWVADTAYAICTLALAAETVGATATWVRSCSPAELALVAGLPEPKDWAQRWSGSGPETCLSALVLNTSGAGPVPHAQVLRSTRSRVDHRALAWPEQARTLGPRRDERPTIDPGDLAPHADDILLPGSGLAAATLAGRLRTRRSAPLEKSPSPDPRPVLDADSVQQPFPRPPRTSLRAHPRGAAPADNDQAWLTRCDTLLSIEHDLGHGPGAGQDLLAATWWAAATCAHLALTGPPNRPIGGWTHQPGEDPHHPAALTVHGLALWHPSTGVSQTGRP